MKKPTPAPSFEEALTELDLIVQQLEEGRLTLEDSLASYEKGVKLIQQCQQQLHKAEKRVMQLTGRDEDGQPVLEPFPDQ